jgi:hypothetical protein
VDKKQIGNVQDVILLDSGTQSGQSDWTSQPNYQWLWFTRQPTDRSLETPEYSVMRNRPVSIPRPTTFEDSSLDSGVSGYLLESYERALPNSGIEKRSIFPVPASG